MFACLAEALPTPSHLYYIIFYKKSQYSSYTKQNGKASAFLKNCENNHIIYALRQTCFFFNKIKK